MKTKRRNQAYHTLRTFYGDFSKGLMFRRRLVRKRVKPATYSLKLTVLHELRQH